MNYLFANDDNLEEEELNDRWTLKVELTGLERELEELVLERANVLMSIEPENYNLSGVDMTSECGYKKVISEFSKSFKSFTKNDKFEKLREIVGNIYGLEKEIKSKKEELEKMLILHDFDEEGDLKSIEETNIGADKIAGAVNEVSEKAVIALKIGRTMEGIVKESFPDAKLRMIQIGDTSIEFDNPKDERPNTTKDIPTGTEDAKIGNEEHF